MSQGTIDPNSVAISQVPLTFLCSNYPLVKIRNDMGGEEYIRYKNDWAQFTKVWSYNYTVSTLRGGGDKSYKYYQFLSNQDAISYKSGQNGYATVYYPSTVFADIPKN